MAIFDTDHFTRLLVAPLREKLQGVAAPEPRERTDLLERDISLTLRAIQITTDARSLRALQDDLERVLPARRDAILSALVSHVASEDHARLVQILDVILTIGLAAAKAFLRA